METWDLIELIHFLVEKGAFTIHSEFSLALQNDQKKVRAKSITYIIYGNKFTKCMTKIDHIQVSETKPIMYFLHFDTCILFNL